MVSRDGIMLQADNSCVGVEIPAKNNCKFQNARAHFRYFCSEILFLFLGTKFLLEFLQFVSRNEYNFFVRKLNNVVFYK